MNIRQQVVLYCGLLLSSFSMVADNSAYAKSTQRTLRDKADPWAALKLLEHNRAKEHLKPHPVSTPKRTQVIGTLSATRSELAPTLKKRKEITKIIEGWMAYESISATWTWTHDTQLVTVDSPEIVDLSIKAQCKNAEQLKGLKEKLRPLMYDESSRLSSLRAIDTVSKTEFSFSKPTIPTLTPKQKEDVARFEKLAKVALNSRDPWSDGSGIAVLQDAERACFSGKTNDLDSVPQRLERLTKAALMPFDKNASPTAQLTTFLRSFSLSARLIQPSPVRSAIADLAAVPTPTTKPSLNSNSHEIVPSPTTGIISFRDRIDRGNEARKKGEFEQAIAEYKEALRIKDDAGVHLNLADIYRFRDKCDDAIKEYQAAAGLKDSAIIQVRLGQALQAKGNLKSAIAAYEKAVELKPTDEDSIDALKTGWEECIKQDPMNPEIHIGFGRSLALSGDFGMALAEYEMAIRLSKGSNPTAQKLLDSLERAKEERVNLLVSDGLKQQQEKNYVGAIELYQRALRLQPADSQKSLVLLSLASAQYEHEDYSSALTSYKETLEANRNQIDALYFIAMIEEHIGKGAPALENYEKYLAQAPHGKYEKLANARIAALKRDINNTRKIKSEAEIVREQAEHFATKAPEPLTSSKKKSEPEKGPAPQRSSLYKPPIPVDIKPSVNMQDQLGAYADYLASHIGKISAPKLSTLQNRLMSEALRTRIDPLFIVQIDCMLEVSATGRVTKLELAKDSPFNSGYRHPDVVRYEELAFRSIREASPFNPLPLGLRSARFRVSLGKRDTSVIVWDEHFWDFLKSVKVAQQAPPAKTQIEQKPVDYGLYLQRADRQIKRNWNPPKGNETIGTKVAFSVDTKGYISNARITKESGNKQFDQLAVAAVITAGKLDPPPDGAPNPLDIEFTFDYNVYKGETANAGQHVTLTEAPARNTSANIQPDPISFAPYIAELTRRIERVWYSRNEALTREIKSAPALQPNNGDITGVDNGSEDFSECLFDISSDGVLSNLQIDHGAIGAMYPDKNQERRDRLALESIKDVAPFRPYGVYSGLGSVKTARFQIYLSGSKVKITLVPKDGRQNLEAQLKSIWKPSGLCPRGFAVLSFDPSQKSNQISVYNSSFDQAFDESAKALLNQVKGCSWDIPEGSNWHITFRSNGVVEVDTPRSIDFEHYVANLQRQIKRNWNPTKDDKTRCVQAFLKVRHDGKLTNLRLEKSSGSDVADSTGLEAIRTASPFPPLPEGAPDEIEIQFTLGRNSVTSNQSDQNGNDNTAAITLNNEGVRALNDKKFTLAIKKLEESLKLNPAYELARRNLSIAYNNIGLENMVNNASVAISYFKKAVQCDSTNKVANDNLIKATEDLPIQTTISEFFCAWPNGDIAGIKAVVSDKQKGKVAELYRDADEVRKASLRMLWPESLEFSPSSPSSGTTKTCSVQGLLGSDGYELKKVAGVGPGSVVLAPLLEKKWKVTIFLVKEDGRWKVDTIDWARSNQPKVKEPERTGEPSFFSDGDFVSKPVYIRPAPEETKKAPYFRTY